MEVASGGNSRKAPRSSGSVARICCAVGAEERVAVPRRERGDVDAHWISAIPRLNEGVIREVAERGMRTLQVREKLVERGRSGPECRLTVLHVGQADSDGSFVDAEAGRRRDGRRHMSRAMRGWVHWKIIGGEPSAFRVRAVSRPSRAMMK